MAQLPWQATWQASDHKRPQVSIGAFDLFPRRKGRPSDTLLLSFVVVVLLFVVCCLLFVVCCLLFVVCCLLFVVCCSVFCWISYFALEIIILSFFYGALSILCSILYLSSLDYSLIERRLIMALDDIEDLIGSESGGIEGFRPEREPLVYANVSNLDKKNGMRNPKKKIKSKSRRALQKNTDNDENITNDSDTDFLNVFEEYNVDQEGKSYAKKEILTEEYKQLENQQPNLKDINKDLLLKAEEPRKRHTDSNLLDSNGASLKFEEDKDNDDEVSINSTSDLDSDCADNDTVIPGTESIWLKTFGCSHNVSDSEYMQGLLGAYGYQFVDEYDRESADIWVINSCTVKDPSQSAFTNIIKRAKELHIPIVVCGCVPQADRKLKDLDGISMVGIQQIDRVVEVVEQTLLGNTVRLLAKGSLPSLDLPKIRKNPMIEIVPLSTGCLGACTYCKTKHARGALGSYTIEAIVNRIKKVISEGVTEVWLSSEDTGAYGRDINTSLSNLLDAILPILPHDVMLRIGMTNPPFILDQLPAVAKALNHPNVFTFLHIPVQSGSDKVLLDMNREYTVGEFRRVADYLLEHVPGMTIATDIICGFPGETEEEFEDTLKLVKDYEFPVLNISQFYPRPGTPAAKMKRIETKIVKGRSRKLTILFGSYDSTKTVKVGDVTKIWINTEVADDGIHIVGHTKGYVKVLVPYSDDLLGATATVKITSLARFHVTGELIAPDAYRQINPDHPLDLENMIKVNRSNILMTHGPKTRLSNLDREDYGDEDGGEDGSVSSNFSRRSTRSNKSVSSTFSTLSSRSHSNPAKNILPALINKAGINLDSILEEIPENIITTNCDSNVCCGGGGGCSTKSSTNEIDTEKREKDFNSNCCMSNSEDCCGGQIQTEETSVDSKNENTCCGGSCVESNIEKSESTEKKGLKTVFPEMGVLAMYLSIFIMIYTIVYSLLKGSHLMNKIFTTTN